MVQKRRSAVVTHEVPNHLEVSTRLARLLILADSQHGDAVRPDDLEVILVRRLGGQGGARPIRIVGRRSALGCRHVRVVTVQTDRMDDHDCARRPGWTCHPNRDRRQGCRSRDRAKRREDSRVGGWNGQDRATTKRSGIGAAGRIEKSAGRVQHPHSADAEER